MEKQEWNRELEQVIEERVRKVVQEENAALLSALLEGLKQGMERVFQGDSRIPNGWNGSNREESTREGGGANPEPAPVELVFRNTKGVRKKTMETAKIVVACLQEQGPLKLTHLREEVEKRGGDLGSNATIRMKSIMRICPAIKKAGHGLYRFDPEPEHHIEESE